MVILDMRTRIELEAIVDGRIEANLVSFVDQQERDNYIQALVNEEARRYLSETDWYVIRNKESGDLIPSDVTQKRINARNAIVE